MTGISTALDGIKVLDLASLYAGLLIAINLGNYGADVIRVEHPHGDDARRWDFIRDGVPLWWKSIARNKRLITLDLHGEAARQTVPDLVGLTGFGQTAPFSQEPGFGTLT
ncbi:hypothetical protein GCM10010840_36670 [Deinococcus aerolatus]|uniref:L-carnitine dehydratase/bile acid-inducible protein F n=1 Tax=Deinococcus aerolatus TaxID=522487 RepID=A0ABQ2GGQ8_9DEIO|nr:CoA transferase [Deinococcus aerolatus]GGL95248.1 hypothetical protein GCM10010840_36670 [Deinococcus aerolatus]